MPKVGMEPIRRSALVKATIAEIGEAQSLDVTVSQIAKRAGMSSALAHQSHQHHRKAPLHQQGIVTVCVSPKRLISTSLSQHAPESMLKLLLKLIIFV